MNKLLGAQSYGSRCISSGYSYVKVGDKVSSFEKFL